MDKFNEVSNDIINAIDKLKYEDCEKRLIHTNIMINIYKMFESRESYDESIDILKREDINKKKRKLKM